jgi:hypothetical protein
VSFGRYLRLYLEKVPGEVVSVGTAESGHDIVAGPREVYGVAAQGDIPKSW